MLVHRPADTGLSAVVTVLLRTKFIMERRQTDSQKYTDTDGDRLTHMTDGKDWRKGGRGERARRLGGI